MKMDISEITERAKLPGDHLTDQEKVFLLQNNAHALAAFLIANNPGNVNLSLRQMGYTHLSFEPNPVQLMRQLEILIDRKDVEALATVLKKFNLITDGLSPEFVQALKTISFN